MTTHKKINRVDEGVKEVFTSKSFRIYLYIIGGILICPIVFVCMFLLLGIPLAGVIGAFFQMMMNGL